jgi:hypothetical protein
MSALKYLVNLGVLSLFLSISHPLLAQITFERVYIDTSSSAGYSVQETRNGGYIVAGGIGSVTSNLFSFYLIRTDPYGDTLWKKIYGGLLDDESYSVQETSGGGFIIAGRTRSFGAGSNDIYLIKTDSLGDILWTRTYGGSEFDYGYSVQETNDRGYIITGGTWSFGSGNNDVYLIRSDSLGDTLWTRFYGGPSGDEGFSVLETQDEGYIIAGNTLSYGAGLQDVYLIRTDENGDTLWTRTYGGASWDYGRSVRETQDGGYIIVGWTNSFGASLYDVYLIKTDSLGDTLWTTTLGGSDFDMGSDIQETWDGGYMIVGTSASYGMGARDLYLVKTDLSGNTLWKKTYGGTSDDAGEAIQETQDGGYIITGNTASYKLCSGTPCPLGDVYLIKTDGNGSVGVEEESNIKYRTKNIEFRLFENYPNPFTQFTAISYQIPSTNHASRIPSASPALPVGRPSGGHHVSLKIYDITGRMVKVLVDEPQEPGFYKLPISSNQLQGTGIYFYRLQASDVTATKKLTLVR